LNLLGRDAIRAMRISLDDLLFSEATFDKMDHQLLAIPRSDRVDQNLQQACRDLSLLQTTLHSICRAGRISTNL